MLFCVLTDCRRVSWCPRAQRPMGHDQFRYKMFEGHKKPTELTERDRALVRKREELGRLCERQRNAALTARALRRHQIAELEARS